MKISDVESTRAGQIVGVNRPQPVVGNSDAQSNLGSNGGAPAATVELSQSAQTINLAKQAVDAVPDTRDDLVSRIKSQVDAGTYNVSGDDIADQMYRRAQADSIR
jgi:negative regulator of flagellin synthesis FlgM